MLFINNFCIVIDTYKEILMFIVAALVVAMVYDKLTSEEDVK